MSESLEAYCTEGGFFVALGLVGIVVGMIADWFARKLAGTDASANSAWFGRRLLVGVGFGVFVTTYGLWTVRPDFAVFHITPNLFDSPSVRFEESLGPMLLRYGFHLAVVFVMLVATLTDFDEYIIPDALMIPATVLALGVMIFPWAHLPAFRFCFEPERGIWSLSERLSAFPSSITWTPVRLTATMLLCWYFWCFALLDRRWYTPLGTKRAAILFFRRLKKSPLTRLLFVLAILGTLGIWTVCRANPYPNLSATATGLLSALVGMVVGMGLIWTVRIVGGLALQREAMGFGDVVLMGWIGAVVGWQGSILVFFLAPLAGLVFGVARALFRSEREIPYGPFLCLATVAVLVFWPPLWDFVGPILSDGTVVAILGGLAVGILVVLLGAIRFFTELFFRAPVKIASRPSRPKIPPIPRKPQ